MLTESEAETQLKDLHQQLTDIEQIKKSYEAKMAASSPTRSAAEITASIKGKLHQDSFTAQEKRAALQTILASVIVERVDDTRGRGSKPEIHVQIQLK
ncbi:hypothetical protein SDC9_208715 [bioreactor metagenome]|uniref:Uncharacterized protein n=1 Tax=bioreactor metagenome TaxID=1076179 RepID=A0A645JBF0_9ZZZZ